MTCAHLKQKLYQHENVYWIRIFPNKKTKLVKNLACCQ